MGIDNNTFIGVFVFVKSKTIQVEKTREIYVSANGKKHKSKIKFDPEDGSPVIVQEEKYFEEIKMESWTDLYDLFDEDPDFDEDLFYCPEYLETEDDYKIWLPNKGNATGDYLESSDFIDFDDIDIEKRKKEFEEEYGSELDKVRKYFDDIQISYGVVNYQS